MASSSDGSVIVAGSWNGGMYQCDAVTGESELVFSGDSFPAACLTYSFAGLRIATSGDNDVRVRNA